MSAIRAAIVAEARTWLGTPYHHHARIKGAGVDCAQILLAVYCDALGLAPSFDAGHYSTQWHLHRSEELYLQWLAMAGARRVQTPAPGDIAMFRFGRTYSHSAIHVGDGLLVHAYGEPVGRVIESGLGEEPLVSREVQHWSILGEGA
jgi:cell wall-associated NlpC family hydrolase